MFHDECTQYTRKTCSVYCRPISNGDIPYSWLSDMNGFYCCISKVACGYIELLAGVRVSMATTPYYYPVLARLDLTGRRRLETTGSHYYPGGFDTQYSLYKMQVRKRRAGSGWGQACQGPIACSVIAEISYPLHFPQPSTCLPPDERSDRKSGGWVPACLTGPALPVLVLAFLTVF